MKALESPQGESPTRVLLYSESLRLVCKMHCAAPPALAPLTQSEEGGGPQLEAASRGPAGHTPPGTSGEAQAWLTHLGNGYLGSVWGPQRARESIRKERQLFQ